MTEWKMNTAQLEKGMLIRRPGLDEALEVLKVHGGQAKIKLPDGKTSTIPASAEVEWSRPEMHADKLLAGNTREAFLEANPEIASNPAPIHISDVVEASGWQNDWNLLDVGSKIEVLGEKGDFTILRLSDSNARIKHNATGQIQPLSIGHKFKVIDGGTSKEGRAVKEKGKQKASKKPAPKAPEPPLQEPDIESDIDLEPEIAADEPSDEILAKIENGDEIDDEDLDNNASDDDLEDDDETNLDDNDQEDDDMPAPRSTPKPAASRSNSTSLLTLGQVAERTGISYPTLVRYVRDHGDRLPSEGEGRSRRYYPDAIDIFNEIRSSTKGGRKPGSVSNAAGSKSANPRKPRSDKGTSRVDRPERSHETAAPYAAPARIRARAGAAPQPVSSSGTIDQALASAIDHARGQMEGLQLLIENLEAQRESLKLWS